VRKPTEMFFPVSATMNRLPADTWRQYAPLFREYSTATVTAELLAALAQVEGAGNPIARTSLTRRHYLSEESTCRNNFSLNGTVNLSGRVSWIQRLARSIRHLVPTHAADFGPDLECLEVARRHRFFRANVSRESIES
jgi:hypothetical protein